ncbi:MAG: NAD(P)H-dependent oxidoreductase [Saprospiraceae bacterium]
MISIISGTDRPNSKTSIIARWCFDSLTKAGIECKLLDLSEINFDYLNDSGYNEDSQHPGITELQQKYLIPSSLWLVVSPEYNGSFPGILKLFIDALSVNDNTKTFSGKKVSLIGVASGRAGNFRGMEHLTGIFNYLNMIVMPNKLPVSSVEKAINEVGEIEENTKNTLTAFMEDLKQFAALNF